MNSTQPLSSKERVHVHTRLRAGRVAAIVNTGIAGLVLLVSLSGQIDGSTGIHLDVLVMITLLCGGVFFVSWWLDRHLAIDVLNGQKTLIDTTIVRLQRIGIFDFGGGGSFQALFGSIYYMWISSANPEIERRRFRLKRKTYHELRLYRDPCGIQSFSRLNA